jgi:hypothetical protein
MATPPRLGRLFGRSPPEIVSAVLPRLLTRKARNAFNDVLTRTPSIGTREETRREARYASTVYGWEVPRLHWGWGDSRRSPVRGPHSDRYVQWSGRAPEREVDDDRGLDLEQNVEKRAWARDYTMHPQPGHADAQRQRGGRTRSPPRDH